MQQIVTHPLASDFTASDIDKYTYHISDLSKYVETLSFLTDVEKVDERLMKYFNEDVPPLCGHWQLTGTALHESGNMMEAFIILRRVRLLPDKEGKINFFKWSKEQ